MITQTNPSFDIARLGHVEILTDRLEDSLDFVTRVLGLQALGLKTIEMFHTHGTPPVQKMEA